MFLNKLTRWRISAVAVLGLGFTGCRKKEAAASATDAGPQEVRIQVVRAEKLLLQSRQPGRLEAYRQAEVRARVPGIVIARPYQEGQEVKAGDVLFQIDPAPLQAAFDSSTSALEEAQAVLALARERRERYVSLGSGKAVSALDLKQVDAEEKQALARAGSAKAAKETARLQLEYATVTSPIDGRARRAAVTEGALVGEGSATLLTTVEQIDPIYVNFSQPVAEVVALRSALAKGSVEGLKPDEIKVSVMLADGSEYAEKGQLIFSDLAVDAGTDTVQLRALIPNPKRELFPGMFVRVSMDVAVENKAVLVPRDALVRSSEGASVMSVNDRNEVTPITVQAGEIHGNRWHVTSGLAGGERIIVENPAYAPVGAAVVPVEAK